jgi:hydroxyacylglutathione hydrolase
MITIQTFTFNPVQENTYVLYNEHNNAIIIDPGCYFAAEEETLKNFIAEKKLTVKYLINTHCHFDHIFGNNFVVKTYNVLPTIHTQDEVILRNATQAALKWNLSFTNYDGALNYVNEHEIIFLDQDELQVILAPGHSPGHICLYNKKQHFLIGGDVLFYESIGRTDFPLCNHEELIKNIKEKLFTLPNETIVYAGHNETTTIEHEKAHNPFVI